MKILMINCVCGIRSTGRICTDLAMELEKQGHEVKIAYGRFDAPEKFQKYAVRIGSENCVKINALKARAFDNEGLNAVGATKTFLKWVKEYNPDVIHLHNLHGYYINYPLLFDYLRTCGKKIIWTLHDCWAFTGHTAYCDAVGCEKWKNGCDHCPQIKEYPKAMVDHAGRNWKLKKKCMTGIPNMTIVTPSQWLAELVKKSFLGVYPVEVIHNGIDTLQFQALDNDFKETHGISDKKMLVGVATAWDENKGYSDYLRLADMLGDEYQIVLVGVTERQKRILPRNVIGITRTNSVKELAMIYSAADYVLNLSKTENYPTVNLEAICCGTQVITYDVGGSKESVIPAGGIVVEKGNIIAVAETIVKNDGQQRAQCMTEYFDSRTTIKKYLELIH